MLRNGTATYGFDEIQWLTEKSSELKCIQNAVQPFNAHRILDFGNIAMWQINVYRERQSVRQVRIIASFNGNIAIVIIIV